MGMLQEETKRWIKIAESDFDSSQYLFNGARYPQAVYLLCQAIEKILKAAIVEFTKKAPKKIHRLENLAKESKLKISENQYDIFTDISKHYSRVRYPDISGVSYNTKKKVEPIMKSGKEIYLWIRKQLKNQ